MEENMSYPIFKSVVAMLFLGMSWSACQATESVEAPATPKPLAAEPAINTLTEEEKAEGWQLLFDGQHLDQWRGFKMETVPPGWSVEDGVLQFSSDHGGEGYGDLMTKEQFANFELKLDWKISKHGNSGVLFRVTENYDQEFHTGPEVQLIDNDHPEIEPLNSAGANYGLHAPAKDVTKPVGQWNTLHLIVDGPHVEHWMNGEKLVEYELWTDEWKKLVAGTKFKQWADYGMNKSGHIVLQDHGAGVWFRNLKVKPLS
jgi:hypothetical protein